LAATEFCDDGHGSSGGHARLGRPRDARRRRGPDRRLAEHAV